MKTTAAAIVGLIASLISGFVGYIYRDAFDSPRLSLTHASIEAPSQSIALEDQAFDLLKVDGNVSSFLEDRVDWDANEAIDHNVYTYEQIGDFRELLPAIGERFSRLKRDYIVRLKVFETARNDLPELGASKSPALAANQLLTRYPAISRRLAATRNYYRSVWKIDIFDEYTKNPERVIGLILSDIQGDLTQAEETLQTLAAAAPALEAVWSSGEPAKLPVVGDKVPTMIVTLIVSNTGRTSGLLHQTGTLTYKDISTSIVLYDQKAKRRMRSQEFAKLPSGDTTTLHFALNTERNSRSDEKAIYEAVVARRGVITIELVDIKGDLLTYKLDLG